MNHLSDFLLRAVARDAEGPFLTDLRLGTSYSLTELLDAATMLQGFLAARGIEPGERIAYLTRNNCFFYPLLFASARQSCALVPISAESSPNEVNAVLENSEATAVFYDELVQRRHPELVCDDWISVGTPSPQGMLPANILKSAEEVEVHDCASNDGALIIYTSGTTSKPKGIVLTHRNLTSMAESVSDFYDYHAHDRFLCCLPFHHINGPMITGLACIARNSHIFLTYPFGFEIARSYWNIVHDNSIQVLSITPSIMATLLKLFPQGAPTDITSVKMALVGTAALDEQLWKQFEDMFKVACYQGYGLTETTTWATMTPQDERKRYDTVGVPVGCEVSIDTTVDAGEIDSTTPGVGEILVRGNIVLKEYHRNKSLTRRQVRDGWFRTGDLGYLDTDGQLVIVGRIKNIIKRRGVLVVPEEIDDALSQQSSVSECCSVGVQHQIMGEEVVTACVLKDEADDVAADIRKFLAGLISSHKMPDRFLFLKRLPRNTMGKIDINRLRKTASGEMRDEILRQFNTRRVIRARSPDVDQISQIIERSILEDEPLHFSGFWGVGRRRTAEAVDHTAMDRLLEIMRSIDAVFGSPLSRITLILTDVHGRANGVDPECAEAYFDSITAAATDRGFEVVKLSSLWERYGLDYASTIGGMVDGELSDDWDKFPLKDDFVQQAAKRVSGTDLAEDAAKRYYAVVTAENPIVAQEFAGSIFFTYNGPEYRQVLPRLPLVHWYSTRRGWSDKPWFIDDYACAK